MPGLLLTFLSAFSSVCKGLAGKRSSRDVATLPDVFMTNAIRMSLCTVIGLAVVLVTQGASALAVCPATLWSALLYAFALASNVTLWIICIRVTAYIHLDIFGAMNIVVSILLCLLFLGESATLLQIVGALLMLAANGVTCLEKRRAGDKLTLRSLLPLLGLMVSGGLIDFAMKVYNHLGTADSSAAFNFYAFAFTAAFLFAGLVFVTHRGPDRVNSAVIRRVFPFTAIMAGTMFLTSFTKTLAGSMLPAVVLIPVYKGVETILGVLAAAFLLKEKPSRGTLLAVCLSFAAIVIINL